MTNRTCVASDTKWKVYLAASFVTFGAGLVAIIITRLLLWLRDKRIGRSCYCCSGRPPLDAGQSSSQHSTHKRSLLAGFFKPRHIDVTLLAEIKEWAGEIISGQTITGQVLVCLAFLLSLGAIGIYIFEASRYANQVERCITWATDPLQQADMALSIFFLIHFVIRFTAAQDKLAFWCGFYSLVEFFTVVPSFLNVYLDRTWLGLRFVRALRIMTLPDVMQYLNILKPASVMRLWQLVTIFVALWMIGSGAVLLLENSSEEGMHMTFGSAMYFTIVTMSTVGYGDISPKTYLGRIFVSAYILVALGIFTSYIPEIAMIIVNRPKYGGYYKKEGNRRHVVICGDIDYASVDTFLADFLHEDREEVDVHAVFINPTKPDLQLQGLLKRNFTRVSYFQGTVMNTADCDRVMLDTADACIVLAEKRCEDPLAEDAANIMRVVSLKNYSPKTRVIVQLLQYPSKVYLLNIPNWNWSEGDDVVCLAELKLGFLAQNCVAPGFSTLLANLFAMRSYEPNNEFGWLNSYLRGASMEIYTDYFSESFAGMNFAEASCLCFSKLELLLVAIEAKNPDNGESYLAINPGPSVIIQANTQGFFVCDSADYAHRVYLYCRRCHSDMPNQKIGLCCCRKHLKKIDNRDESRPTLKVRSATLSIKNNGAKTITRPNNATLPDIDKPSPTASRHSQEADTTAAVKFDPTGMFYWAEPRSFASCCLTCETVAAMNLKQHVVVCAFSTSDSAPIGLRNFAMPLRASNFDVDELKDIVIIGDGDYLKREWSSVHHFSNIFVVSGSPMNRAILRAVNIHLCDMCVIMSSIKKCTASRGIISDPYLADKEVILASLNIKSMAFEIDASQSISPVITDGVEEPNASLGNTAGQVITGSDVPMITELLVDSNIQFLDQDDDDTGNAEIYTTQSFACGTAFTESLLDSLLSTAYFNRNAMTLIRTMITGGTTPEFEKMLSEGRPIPAVVGTPELAAVRQRSLVQQLAIFEGPFAQFAGGGSYGSLFEFASHNYGILLLGLYRFFDKCVVRHDHEAADATSRNIKRYVITNPPASTVLRTTDLVFCLKPV